MDTVELWFVPSQSKMVKLNILRPAPRCCVRQLYLFCIVSCSVSLVLLVNLPNFNDRLVPSRMELAAIAEKMQRTRRNLIEEKCLVIPWKSRKNSGPVTFKIENRHQIMYCDVPKVATTNLKRLMLILSGVVETENLSSIPRLAVHEQNPMLMLDAFNLTDTIKNGLGHFTKFIFVRHPYERLVSAYRDKLAGDNTFYRKAIGREVIRKYRKNANQLSLQNGHDVTFPEFVNFIVHQWKDGRELLDVHWRPIVDLCLPCAMRYDFIGKFETLNQDVEFLLQKLNRENLSQLFTSNKGQPKTTHSLWRQFMKMLSHQQLSDLNRMFGDDFKLFGYPPYTGEE